ncbi:hypothetical protein GCM10009722_15390 [Williamsia deligens]
MIAIIRSAVASTLKSSRSKSDSTTERITDTLWGATVMVTIADDCVQSSDGAALTVGLLTAARSIPPLSLPRYPRGGRSNADGRRRRCLCRLTVGNHDV